MATGIYFSRLTTPTRAVARKLLLIRYDAVPPIR